jgi:hypothetical protein
MRAIDWRRSYVRRWAHAFFELDPDSLCTDSSRQVCRPEPAVDDEPCPACLAVLRMIRRQEEHGAAKARAA